LVVAGLQCHIQRGPPGLIPGPGQGLNLGVGHPGLLVIALTDCYPEPLTLHSPDPFDEPAYRESVRAAKLFRKDKVPLLLINPTFSHHQEKDYFPGEKLSAAIERESGGRLIKLYRNMEFAQTQPSQGIPPSHRDILRLISGVEEMVGNRRLGEDRRIAV
jgi:hypothetical protein